MYLFSSHFHLVALAIWKHLDLKFHLHVVPANNFCVFLSFFLIFFYIYKLADDQNDARCRWCFHLLLAAIQCTHGEHSCWIFITFLISFHVNLQCMLHNSSLFRSPFHPKKKQNSSNPKLACIFMLHFRSKNKCFLTAQLIKTSCIQAFLIFQPFFIQLYIYPFRITDKIWFKQDSLLAESKSASFFKRVTNIFKSASPWHFYMYILSALQFDRCKWSYHSISLVRCVQKLKGWFL